MKKKENNLSQFKKITAFVFDVDGVLTDGSLLITEKGELLRTMNIKDGYAIKTAIQQGYKVAIITSGKSDGVIKRLKDLGVTDIYSNVSDKKEALEEFISTYEIPKEKILYMADDMPDLECMKMVGLPASPHDAIPEITKISNYISSFDGGQGCVRDVIEKVLKLNNKWPNNE